VQRAGLAGIARHQLRLPVCHYIRMNGSVDPAVLPAGVIASCGMVHIVIISSASPWPVTRGIAPATRAGM
jgi:hypothetical protein